MSPPESAVTRVVRFGSDAPPVLIVLALAFAAGFGAVWAFERRGRGRFA